MKELIWWENLTKLEKLHYFNLHCDDRHKSLFANPVESLGDFVIIYIYKIVHNERQNN